MDFNLVAQIISFLAVVLNIVSMQFKNKENIIKAFLAIGIMFTLTFLLLGAYSGAVVAFFTFIQTFINYKIEKKNKRIPKRLVTVYLIISIILGIVFFKVYSDLLPIIASVLYTLSIVPKKEKYIRILTLFNVIAWVAYDTIIGIYFAAILNVFLVLSTLIAIIRYDILKEKNIKKTETNIVEE